MRGGVPRTSAAMQGYDGKRWKLLEMLYYRGAMTRGGAGERPLREFLRAVAACIDCLEELL